MKRILWAIFLIAASANLPAPLFPHYQEIYQLSELGIAALFAIYAACLLPVLLISGSLARRKGPRAVSILGLALAFFSALLFACASEAWLLYAARILEGFAVGAFMGAGNALLLEHSARPLAQSLKYSSMSNMFGFGFGPLLCGLMIAYVPVAPHRLPYLCLLAGLSSALALFFTLEKKTESLNPAEPLRIALGLPPECRRFFWTFIAPAAFTMLALNGIVISLIPTYMKTLFHSGNPAAAGLLLFIMLSGSGAAQAISRPAAKIQRVKWGVSFLTLGAWLMVAAAPLQSFACLSLGMILQAIGTGWTFQGTLQLTGECAAPQKRSAAISTFFVCAYSGMAFPTMGIGLLSNLCGLMTALLIFSVCITAVSAAIVCAPRFGGAFILFRETSKPPE